MRWADRIRVLIKKERDMQFLELFKVVHTRVEELSATHLGNLNFRIPIGGLAVGEGQEKMFKTIEYTSHLWIQTNQDI